jgi:hypothetical protein
VDLPRRPRLGVAAARARLVRRVVRRPPRPRQVHSHRQLALPVVDVDRRAAAHRLPPQAVVKVADGVEPQRLLAGRISVA